MIIHLCGMPGVGKLTIAKHLKTLMSARLIDNHLFVDLAEAVCDRDEDYVPFVDNLMALAFSKLAVRHKDKCIILTNALAEELPEDIARLENVRQLAVAMDCAFVPVLITCSHDENNKRLVAEDRATKGKLRNTEILNQILEKYTPAHLPHHHNALTIDNSNLDAVSAAQMIVEHCANCASSKETK